MYRRPYFLDHCTPVKYMSEQNDKTPVDSIVLDENTVRVAYFSKQ